MEKIEILKSEYDELLFNKELLNNIQKEHNHTILNKNVRINLLEDKLREAKEIINEHNAIMDSDADFTIKELLDKFSEIVSNAIDKLYLARGLNIKDIKIVGNNRELYLRVEDDAIGNVIPKVIK